MSAKGSIQRAPTLLTRPPRFALNTDTASDTQPRLDVAMVLFPSRLSAWTQYG
jgi:hypothetical protein